MVLEAILTELLFYNRYEQHELKALCERSTALVFIFLLSGTWPRRWRSYQRDNLSALIVLSPKFSLGIVQMCS